MSPPTNEPIVFNSSTADPLRSSRGLGGSSGRSSFSSSKARQGRQPHHWSPSPMQFSMSLDLPSFARWLVSSTQHCIGIASRRHRFTIAFFRILIATTAIASTHSKATRRMKENSMQRRQRQLVGNQRTGGAGLCQGPFPHTFIPCPCR